MNYPEPSLLAGAFAALLWGLAVLVVLILACLVAEFLTRGVIRRDLARAGRAEYLATRCGAEFRMKNGTVLYRCRLEKHDGPNHCDTSLDFPVHFQVDE